MATASVWPKYAFSVFFIGGLAGACAPRPVATAWTDAVPAERPKPPVIGDAPLARNANIGLGLPAMRVATEILISHKQYVLSWNDRTRNVNWAAWRLRDADLGAVSRTDHFAIDEALQDYLTENTSASAVRPEEFVATCIDRGHQVPSGDRTDSRADNAVTFIMSNIIPQSAWLNRTVWQHLEAYSRDQIRGTAGTLYVIAGPIFGEHPRKIGLEDEISVAEKNFKIVVRGGPTPTIVAAVIMPNVTSHGTDPVVDHEQACEDQRRFGKPPETSPPPDWMQYRVSVAAIERAAGINLSFLDSAQRD